MIYLDNENIILPNLLNVDSSSYVIILKNNVTNEIITLDASNNSDNELYYQFQIDASSMAQNEYTISLYDDSSQFLGEFIAQKGINDASIKSFNNDVEYIVFEG